VSVSQCVWRPPKYEKRVRGVGARSLRRRGQSVRLSDRPATRIEVLLPDVSTTVPLRGDQCRVKPQARTGNHLQCGRIDKREALAHRAAKNQITLLWTECNRHRRTRVWSYPASRSTPLSTTASGSASSERDRGWYSRVFRIHGVVLLADVSYRPTCRLPMTQSGGAPDIGGAV
jgi:hypothetical protein